MPNGRQAKSFYSDRRHSFVFLLHCFFLIPNYLTHFALLQASGVRITKTEFIACPSCGRTQFKIQDALKTIKEKTSHLRGLKIAVMGCIVNGPGKMADAHYGYVGSGNGKITLYKGKTVVEKNIPETEAVDKLIELIKVNGDWKENREG